VPAQSGRPQDELPLGDDALELVRDEPSELSTTGSDGDWIAPERPDRHERAMDDDAAAMVDDHEDTVEVDEAPAPRRKGRASVPSWDEIMFGGGKHD
jgi:hypothetical protein